MDSDRGRVTHDRGAVYLSTDEGRGEVDWFRCFYLLLRSYFGCIRDNHHSFVLAFVRARSNSSIGEVGTCHLTPVFFAPVAIVHVQPEDVFTAQLVGPVHQALRNIAVPVSVTFDAGVGTAPITSDVRLLTCKADIVTMVFGGFSQNLRPQERPQTSLLFQCSSCLDPCGLTLKALLVFTVSLRTYPFHIIC